MIDLDDQIIRPLALGCLAYPSGLALSNDDKILYFFEAAFQLKLDQLFILIKKDLSARPAKIVYYALF